MSKLPTGRRPFPGHSRGRRRSSAAITIGDALGIGVTIVGGSILGGLAVRVGVELIEHLSRRATARQAVLGAVRSYVHSFAIATGLRVPRVTTTWKRNAFADLAKWEIIMGTDWLEQQAAAHCVTGTCAAGVIAFWTAHEFAHLIRGHRGGGSGPGSCRRELEADIGAGWLLAIIGYDLAGVGRTLTETGDGVTHPLDDDRRRAVALGVDAARRGMTLGAVIEWNDIYIDLLAQNCASVRQPIPFVLSRSRSAGRSRPSPLERTAF